LPSIISWETSRDLYYIGNFFKVTGDVRVYQLAVHQEGPSMNSLLTGTMQISIAHEEEKGWRTEARKTNHRDQDKSRWQ